MSRKVQDIKDSNGNLIYPKSHAKATYMSNGATVENSILSLEESIKDIDTYIENKINNAVLTVLNTEV